MMKYAFFVVLFFNISVLTVSTYAFNNSTASENLHIEVDSLMEYLFRRQQILYNDTNYQQLLEREYDQPVYLTMESEPVYQRIDFDKVLSRLPQRFLPPHVTHISHSYLRSNPLFFDLRFSGFPVESRRFIPRTMETYFFEQEKKRLVPDYFSPTPFFNLDNQIRLLRERTLRELAVESPYLIAYHVDNLPDVSDLMQFRIDVKPIERAVMLGTETSRNAYRRIEREKIRVSPWTKRSNAMLQFSQNFLSKNWYQGGSNNTAILGIINGRFNYDNKRNVQWENFVEWRLGFNSVEGDTLRFLNTNDDILRASSKIGLKAGGNWFYSGSVDFQTQFFNSYRGINSTAMRTTFLTPVRLNIGIGMDYKYKRLFSLMISPVSYRFIYVNDTINVNKRSFGILPGDRILSQLGSSFRAEFSYSPIRELQINSKLFFYTNYEKFEIDWEITGNFMFNRFLSTRLSLNPRFDNTMIRATGERAKIQYKQLLTVGLSYRLL